MVEGCIFVLLNDGAGLSPDRTDILHERQPLSQLLAEHLFFSLLGAVKNVGHCSMHGAEKEAAMLEKEEFLGDIFPSRYVIPFTNIAEVSMNKRLKSGVNLVLKGLIVAVEDLLTEFLLFVDSTGGLNSAKVVKESDRELFHMLFGIEDLKQHIFGIEDFRPPPALWVDVNDRGPGDLELLLDVLGLEKRHHAEIAADVGQQALEKMGAGVIELEIHVGLFVDLDASALVVEPVVGLVEDSCFGFHSSEPGAKSLAGFLKGQDLVADYLTAMAALHSSMLAKGFDMGDLDLLVGEEVNHKGHALGLGIVAAVVLLSLKRSPLVDVHEAGRGVLVKAPGPEAVLSVAGPGSMVVEGEECEGPLLLFLENGSEHASASLFLGQVG